MENLTFPSTLTSIGKGSFGQCTALLVVELNEGLQSLDDWAFKGCAALGLLKLSSTVATLGEYAFDHCTSLAAVELNQGLHTIGKGAFRDCFALQKVTNLCAVTDVGDFAFLNCRALNSEAPGGDDGRQPIGSRILTHKKGYMT